MKEKIMGAFYELCMKAKNTWENSYSGTSELEPDLLLILKFVKEHAEYKNEFIQGFQEIINGSNTAPLEIVIFCMRELQWQEIKDAAAERLLSHDDWRIKSAMQDIIDVYSPIWGNSDLYQYYSEEK